jgi:hypothetical protein
VQVVLTEGSIEPKTTTVRFPVDPGSRKLWDAVVAVPLTTWAVRLVVSDEAGTPIRPQSTTPATIVLEPGTWVPDGQPHGDGSWTKVAVALGPIPKGARLGDAVDAGTLGWAWVRTDTGTAPPPMLTWNGAEELHATMDIRPGTVLQQELFA